MQSDSPHESRKRVMVGKRFSVKVRDRVRDRVKNEVSVRVKAMGVINSTLPYWV